MCAAFPAGKAVALDLQIVRQHLFQPGYLLLRAFLIKKLNFVKLSAMVASLRAPLCPCGRAMRATWSMVSGDQTASMSPPAKVRHECGQLGTDRKRCSRGNGDAIDLGPCCFEQQHDHAIAWQLGRQSELVELSEEPACYWVVGHSLCQTVLAGSKKAMLEPGVEEQVLASGLVQPACVHIGHERLRVSDRLAQSSDSFDSRRLDRMITGRSLMTTSAGAPCRRFVFARSGRGTGYLFLDLILLKTWGFPFSRDGHHRGTRVPKNGVASDGTGPPA